MDLFQLYRCSFEDKASHLTSRFGQSLAEILDQDTGACRAPKQRNCPYCEFDNWLSIFCPRSNLKRDQMKMGDQLPRSLSLECLVYQ